MGFEDSFRPCDGFVEAADKIYKSVVVCVWESLGIVLLWGQQPKYLRDGLGPLINPLFMFAVG